MDPGKLNSLKVRGPLESKCVVRARLLAWVRLTQGRTPEGPVILQ